MVIVLQERCFLSTCSDLADDTKTKSEVVAHCLVVAEAMLSVFPLSCAGMRQDSADAGVESPGRVRPVCRDAAVCHAQAGSSSNFFERHFSMQR